MRDPNLNIKRSDLAKLIEEVGLAKGHNAETLAKQLVEKGKKFNALNRIVMTKPRVDTRKKMQKLVSASDKEAERFNFLLIGARNVTYKLDLDRMEIIEPGTAKHRQIRETAKIALGFCETFGFTTEAGFARFIDLGLDIMGKRYGLNRFKTMRDRIFEVQIITRDIATDPYKGTTVKGAKLYYKKVFEITKIEAGKNIPERIFVNFVYAAKECKVLKGDIKDWIESQYHRLSYMDALPEPSQIHGEAARQGYIKYMYEVKSKKVTEGNVTFTPEVTDQDRLHFGES